MLTIHASCVAFSGAAVLLRGPSGSGKSDLAMRMIDAGCRLVADDRTVLTRGGPPHEGPARDGIRLIASAPDSIRGLIEIRGLGPIEMIPAAPTPVALLIDLVARDEMPRLPDPDHETLLGVAVPRLRLAPFVVSAAIVARLALQRAAMGRLFEPAEARALRRDARTG